MPSIDGLHATFGTSGSATPAAAATPASAPAEQPQNAWASRQARSNETPTNAAPNGSVRPPPTIDDDGFTQARGGRARGRGRGFRGGERGGFRGGDGGFRGGDRGGFRGGRGELPTSANE